MRCTQRRCFSYVCVAYALCRRLKDSKTLTEEAFREGLQSMYLRLCPPLPLSQCFYFHGVYRIIIKMFPDFRLLLGVTLFHATIG